MNGLKIIQKINPKHLVFFSIYLLPVLFVLQKLTNTVRGMLAGSLFLYFSTDFFSDSKPWSPSQLALWLDALPGESKTAVVTALLTILGFLVAFHSATVNWKAQIYAQIQIDTAKEIEEFFYEVNRLVDIARIDVKSMVEAARDFYAKGPTQETEFSIKWAMQRAVEFRETRSKLVELGISVYRLPARNYSALSTVPGALEWLEKGAEALDKITEKIWIHIPVQSAKDPNPLVHFGSQLNVPECEEFVRCCEEGRKVTAGLVGGLRGTLLSQIVPINWTSLSTVRQRGEAYIQAATLIQKR
jgi:hypothetical protein